MANNLLFANIVPIINKTMNTATYKRTYSLPFTFDDILKLIKSFSIEDKVRLEKELEKETLVYRAQKLSENIKVNNLTMEDVVAEVMEYRKKQNAKGSFHSG
ncbi:MAG: hypothetical protein M1445_15235 [Bacteroidetes bacterium]|nr:hypothetical protein [Bacteroidota bacterium]